MDTESPDAIELLFNEFLLYIKDEICTHKHLYSDLLTAYDNKFEIKYEELPQRVPFFETRDDIYQALPKMRKRSHNKLKTANVYFTKGNNPTLSIDLPSMLDYINIKGIVPRPSSTSSTAVATKTRGSSIEKEIYHPGTIRNLYSRLKLKQHVDNINLSMVNVTNPVSRGNLLTHLFSNLHSSYDTSSDSEGENIDQFIATNIISFIKALKGDSRGSIPTKHAIAKLLVVCAALYGHADGTMPGISYRSLTEYLGVSMQFITNTLQILSASSYAAEPETMSLNPDTDLSLPIDPVYDDEYDFELEHEHDDSLSEHGDDIGDDNNDEYNIPSVGDSKGGDASEDSEYIPLTADISDVVEEAFSRRKARSDKEELDIVTDWWLDHGRIQIDTNDSVCSLCPVRDGHQLHMRRLQQLSTKEMFKLYNKDRETNDNLPPIGLTLFRQARCPCIHYDRYRKCVDQKAVRMRECLETFKKVNAYAAQQGCECSFHKAGDDGNSLAQSMTSATSLMEVLLCEPCALGPAANRDKCFVITQEEIEKEILDNINQINQRIKISRDNIRNPKKSRRLNKKISKIQREQLNIYPYQCCHSKCDECKFKYISNLHNTCNIFKNSTYVVKYKQYVELGKHTKDLMTREMSIPMFITEFIEAIKEYIPHNWDCMNDSFMRKRAIEQLPLDTLLIMTDFSALLVLLGQDDITCNQSKTAIQDVIITLYITLDENNKRIYHTHSHHVWGDKMKEGDGGDSGMVYQNTAFHAAAITHILKKYKKIFDIELKRDLDNVLIYSDGCSGQFKNRNSAVFLSTLCDEIGLDNVVHTYAPTANFKCLVDSSGADTKRVYRDYEKDSGEDHCGNGYMVYKMLVERMGPPSPATASSGLMHIDRREHYYLCNTTQVTKYTVDTSDNNVIIFSNTKFEEDTTLRQLTGIRSRFQIRSHKQYPGKNVVYMRCITCSCDNCLTYNYKDCVYNDEEDILWTRHNLAKKVAKAKKALTNRIVLSAI